MDKKRNKELMEYAERVLSEESCPLFEDRENGVIKESYNGQVSALGVSILMIGLKPTIAVYYQDDKSRRNLLEVITRMLVKDGEKFDNAESLTRYILNDRNDTLKTDIMDCSIALKQVIRTYKLG